jgi:hypothetical protein
MMRDRVFISYSNKDIEWLKLLRKQLKPLEKKGLNVWSDRDIIPGQEWLTEIDKSLDRVKVAVLLVSANFLDSDFIQNQELPRFLKAAERQEITILPVLISACVWEESEIVKFQSPSDPNQPLEALKGHDLNQNLKDIVIRIKKAWENPVWGMSLPEDGESRAALATLRQLASQHAEMTADDVNTCFRRAVRECFPDIQLQDVFPQLNTAQTLGWPQLTQFFDESNKPAAILVQALEQQLNSQTPPAETTAESFSYIALVLERHRLWAHNNRHYTWSTYILDEDKNTYRKFNVLEGLELSSEKVVFTGPLEDEDEIAIDVILAELLSWANHNTTLPMLEIFSPTELLDEPWAELIVEEIDEIIITLLESIPFVLRPTDRLMGICNSNRPRLQNKFKKLTNGQGKWCAKDFAAKPNYLLATVVEKDQDAGVKLLEPLLDQTKRKSWFVGLVRSMVPIAIWYRHGAKVSSDEGIKHLQHYEMLSGEEHGDPICPSCVRYDEVARQRKTLSDHEAAKHLVLMLDHWQRIPPITPQARGATRASSPTTK